MYEQHHQNLAQTIQEIRKLASHWIMITIFFLIHLKGRVTRKTHRDRETDIFHLLLHSQMVGTSRTGSGWSQELHLVFQTLRPTSPAFPWALARSYIRSRATAQRDDGAIRTTLPTKPQHQPLFIVIWSTLNNPGGWLQNLSQIPKPTPAKSLTPNAQYTLLHIIFS